MKSETVTLGERKYELREQAVRPGKAFREALKVHFGSLLELVRQAPELDLDDTNTISDIVRSVGSTLLDSAEILVEMLLLYSPNLKADEEYILDNAVGSQLIDAFIVCLMFTFPFLESQRLKTLVTTFESVGLTQRLTKTNSRSVNGVSGAMNLIKEASSNSAFPISDDESGKPNSVPLES